MAGWHVRAFSPADATACAGIFHRAWNSGHPYAPRVIGVQELVAETEDETILMAEDESGNALGFVSVYLPQGFIHHLYVEPAAQGRGIGAELLRAALALAGGRASLKCQTRNPAALAFYRRQGWTEGEEGMSDVGRWIRLLSP